jgi:Na+/H+-translocating membrane pyrophosphatase
VVVLVYTGQAPKVLEGFGFGAALLAMFMRVGGGIFTKAADVGADLVGKVEQGIPEDDPRNAATIADNVGDNVGDCAGMAADLFESYAVTLVAALILGTAAFGQHGLLFPLIVPAIGVLTAVIGVYITRAREGEGGLKAINRSFYISAVISGVLCVIAAFVYLPSTFADLVNPGDAGVVSDMAGANPQLIASAAVLIGIVLAAVILWLTGFHRHRAQAGEGRGRVVAHRRGHGHPRRHLDRLRVCRLHRPGDRCRRVRRVHTRHRFDHGGAVRGGAGRHRAAHHGRRDRRDGHLRPGLRQRTGHRRDVR